MGLKLKSPKVVTETRYGEIKQINWLAASQVISVTSISFWMAGKYLKQTAKRHFRVLIGIKSLHNWK